MDGQFSPSDPDQRGNGGRRACHITFHRLHAIGRFDRESTAVECDSFTHQRQWRVVGAAIGEHHHSGWTSRTAPDRKQAMAVLLSQFFLVPNLDLDAESRDLFLDERDKRFRIEVSGRFVHPSAGEQRALRLDFRLVDHVFVHAVPK